MLVAVLNLSAPKRRRLDLEILGVLLRFCALDQATLEVPHLALGPCPTSPDVLIAIARSRAGFGADGASA